MSIALLIVGMLSVQVGASWAKGLFPAIGPLATVMLRISFAAIFLVVIWRPWRKKISSEAYRAIALYGLCLGLMNMTFYLSLLRIPLGICVAIEFLGPMSVALYSSQRKIDFLWAFLAAIGIALILPLKSLDQHLDPVGVLLAFVAGICWGFYIFFGKKVGKVTHSGVATSLGMVVASLVTLPFGISASTSHVFSLDILKAGFGVALLSSVIPYSIEMVVLKNMATDTFGILMSLEPAIAALSGLAILGEKLTSRQWVAILFVMVASAGTTITSRRRKILQLDLV